ncbi:TPA: DUF2919 domain-containing protein [Photobacterium damselae]
MLYPIDAYDKHGGLKPSTMLWLSLAFSAKAWVVFIMAGVSRNQGTQLLELIYPVRETLYVGLAFGLPAIGLMWLSGQRHKNNKLVNYLWRHGRTILLATYLTDVILQLYHLVLTQGSFSWLVGINLLLTLWLLLYLYRSSRVKNTFADKPIER